MKKILMAIMLIAPTAAQADCTQWYQDILGTKICMTDDLVNRNPIFSLIDGTTTTAVPQPKCNDGEILVVLPGALTPMCASSLKPSHK